MDVYEALYSTRAMRRLRRDAVPDEVIGRILDAGIRAPSGGNAQDWRFVAVTDRTVIGAIGEHYRRGLATLFGTHYKDVNEAARQAAASGSVDRRTQTVTRVLNSSQHLADHFDDVPLLVFGYSMSAQNASSMWPALWSMCLAARAEGVGSTVTTVLSSFARREVDDILGVPADSPYYQHGCLPMGYPTGTWGIADRKPISKVCFHDRWGEPASFPVPVPPNVASRSQ